MRPKESAANIVTVDFAAHGRWFLAEGPANFFRLADEYPEATKYGRREASRVAVEARDVWEEAAAVRIYTNYGYTDERYVEIL